MNKRRGFTGYLFLSIVMIGLSNLCYQYYDSAYKGVIIDSITMLPLEDVRIYYYDTVPVYSNREGRFQLQGSPNVKLHFRKAGFVWHTEVMAEKKEQTIYLLESNPLPQKFYGKYTRDNTDIIYDGMLVPYEEWRDAFNTAPSEIKSINVFLADKTNGKNKIVIESIFQWNRNR